MKNSLKNIVFAAAIVASGSAFADLGDINPYTGIEYQQSYMKMKSPLEAVAKKSFPAMNLYLGTKVHQNFGVELGYQASTTQKKNFTIPINTVIGTVTPLTGTTGSINGISKVRRQGAFFDLVGFFPVVDTFELLAFVGMAWLKPHVSISQVSGPSNDAAGNRINAALANLSAKPKSVFHFGVGALYMMTHRAGLRVKVGYEATSALRLNSLGDLGIPTSGFKDSLTTAAGLFFKF